MIVQHIRNLFRSLVFNITPTNSINYAYVVLQFHDIAFCTATTQVKPLMEKVMVHGV